ncbi:hypothetical protein [Actinoplanes friuliensis]|uniref:Family 2 glycosyl transferase n=1 Tax=Actinoplanes friuliensis DSM 7358 TaxID=1246995 RepID=U5VTY6_9ACTN|nr:hypothetical protein [Actinoplanes friuliensis]AGZ39081.1 hypothetical protein AFR_03960 [Actinoplanes friuliensis DSM 7358]
MGDFPLHLVQAPPRPRFGRGKALLIGVVTLAMCLFLAGAVPRPALRSPAFAIAGMTGIGSPPAGRSWAPSPASTAGLSSVATAAGQEFALHTAGGDVTFLPGVNLGSTTPGYQPGELSISAAQYRTWFAAMSWLGIRVVRIYTIHPPAFYTELAAHNRANPDRPLYLMQGVYPPDESKRNLFDRAVTEAFRTELLDAAEAVRGRLSREPQRGRASGTWRTDVTSWLAGWIIGAELDPSAATASDQRNASAPAVRGKFFRSTPQASPTERWLAARMDELATAEAADGLSQPIAFVNWPTTDPLRHPEEPLEQEDLYQLDANHVQPTAAWPAGTFASYHAYPYYPDFQRHEPALQTFRYAGRPDPYAGYVTALKRHHRTMPTMITEFGVPSSLGSAHNSPLGRTQGDHSEQEAMRIDAELLRLIKEQGLAGAFLFGWVDEWFKFTWNTIEHQDPERRQLWHDPLTNEQHFGLIAMDAAGSPDAATQYLLDDEDGWPVRRITSRVDEAFVRLRIALGTPAPGTLTLGFDVLPGLTGPPAPGSANRAADAAFFLDLTARTGQAYLRKQLDPLPLDVTVPVAARGPAPIGWQRFELIVDRDLTVPTTGEKLPAELQNAGFLRYGSSTVDSRALWERDGDSLMVRVPWAMLGFADPSKHMVGLPVDRKLTMQASPGIGVTASATGTDQTTGHVTWTNWNRPYYTERLKQGADVFRDAALETATAS